LFRVFADVGNSLEYFFAAESRIDEYAGSLRSDERAIAGTRTRENTDLYDLSLPETPA
jgi:hypothetical protein